MWTVSRLRSPKYNAIPLTIANPVLHARGDFYRPCPASLHTYLQHSGFASARILTHLFPRPTADFVQELYLKELKAYKPTPIKDSDAVGQVATFSLPKTPKSPEEADLASSLKEYEEMAVEVEGQEGAAAGQAAPPVQDWLVEEEEEEPHHH